MPAQVIIKLRSGTALQWGAANTVMASGEVGVETDTKKVKIGDGTTAWNSLSYVVDQIFTSALLSKVNGIQDGAQANPPMATSGEAAELVETLPRLFSPAQIRYAVMSEISRSVAQEITPVVSSFTANGSYLWNKPECKWVRVICYRPSGGVQDATFRSVDIPSQVSVNVPSGII